MTKKMFKRLSILLSVLLVVGLLAPLSALAEENPEVIYTPMAIVDVERFTIGQGFYKEPQLVAIEENDTALDLFKRLVGEENLILVDSSFGTYVSAVKGADLGLESLVIPDYIVDKLEGPATEEAKNFGNPLADKALGQGSYSSAGGWTFLINNDYSSVGMDKYTVQNGDVLRFAFTYWGYGADVNGYQFGIEEPVVGMANKDKLLQTMAEINYEPYLFNSPIIVGAYNDALEIAGNVTVDQEAVDAFTDSLVATVASYDMVVGYKTHIENKGWEKDWVIDNNMSGTSGESLRLEGINIKMQENPLYEVGIRYKTHIENKGWEKDWKEDGDLSGTQGEWLRLEAIEIELTGPDAKLFDVYYQVHAQNVGWMNLAKNGQRAGTAGFGYRLEGIRIQVVPKDGPTTILSEPVVTEAFIDQDAV